MTPDFIDQILELYAARGAEHYGEDVSQTEHAEQCAHHARADGADDALVIAALLHDVGHLMHKQGADAADHGIDTRHERIGAGFLARAFPAEVTEPIALHVQAKRYLAAIAPGYVDRLSAASVQSLALQGGPLTGAECEAFRNHPHHAAALRLRRYDEMGKVVGARPALLASYESLMRSFIGAPKPRDSTDPRTYLDVRDRIARHIGRDDLPHGARLPSERQMQSTTGAARGTVRAALFQLEAEGLIYRKNRSGWYVAPPPIVYDPTRWESFMSYVAAQGRAPRTETLETRIWAATPDLANVFGVAEGAPLFEIRRRRYIDERAALVETIFVDPAMAPGLLDHDLNGSLTAVLRRHYGIDVVRNRVEMSPCALTQREAGALRIRSGLPGLLIKRISYDRQGRVVEYDHEYWLHDALKVTVDIRLAN